MILFKISIALCGMLLFYAKLPEISSDLHVSKKRAIFTINFCIVSVWIGFQLFNRSYNLFSVAELTKLIVNHHYLTAFYQLLSSYFFAYLLSIPILTILALGLLIFNRDKLKGKKAE